MSIAAERVFEKRCERFARELEEVGFVEVAGSTEQTGDYGQPYVTQKGRQRLEDDG